MKIVWNCCLLLLPLSLSCSGDANGEPANALKLKESVEAHSRPLNDIVLTSDGKTLISSSVDQTIKFWDVSSRKIIATMPTKRMYFHMALSSDNKTLVACTGLSDEPHHAQLWDAVNMKKLKTLSGYDWAVMDAAFAPDGKTVYIIDGANMIKAWDVASGKVTKTYNAEDGYECVAVSPDGKLLAFGGFVSAGQGVAALVTVADGKETVRLKGHKYLVTDLVFTRDGKTIVTSSDDDTVRIWEVATGKEIRSLKPGDSVSGIALSPDGKLLATASDKTVKLWEFSTGKHIGTGEGHQQTVHKVVFTPDGKTLISAGNDGAIKYWTVKAN